MTRREIGETVRQVAYAADAVAAQAAPGSAINADDARCPHCMTHVGSSHAPYCPDSPIGAALIRRTVGPAAAEESSPTPRPRIEPDPGAEPTPNARRFESYPLPFDGNEWADYFLETVAAHPDVPTDHATMVTWFAGAIMTGYDRGKADARKAAEGEVTG